MNTQTAAPNAGDESARTTKFPHLPIQFIPAEIETAGEPGKSGGFINVFRYPVAGGWIVGTVSDGMSALAQSFVPDPDRKWTPPFATGKRRKSSVPATGPTPTQPSANALRLRAILEDKMQEGNPGALAVPTMAQSGAATSATTENGAVDPLAHLPPQIKTMVLSFGTDSKVGKTILEAFAPRQSFGGNKPQPHATK